MLSRLLVTLRLTTGVKYRNLEHRPDSYPGWVLNTQNINLAKKILDFTTINRQRVIIYNQNVEASSLELTFHIPRSQHKTPVLILITAPVIGHDCVLGM